MDSYNPEAEEFLKKYCLNRRIFFFSSYNVFYHYQYKFQSLSQDKGLTGDQNA